jgi:hypothetical protein
MCEVYSSDTRYGLMESSCEHGNESQGSIKDGVY